MTKYIQKQKQKYKKIPIEIMEKILQYRTQLLFSEWCIHQEMYIEAGTKQRVQLWLEYFFNDKNSLYNSVLLTDVIIQNIDTLQIDVKPDKLQLKLNISFSHMVDNITTITKKNTIIQKTYCWNIYTKKQYYSKEIDKQLQPPPPQSPPQLQEKILYIKNGLFITQIEED